jgi:hypothetical protein
MALHRIIEKHKANILGQEITYTNRFLKYSESTSYGFKPSKSLVSSGVYVFKYTYEHPQLPPTLFVAPISSTINSSAAFSLNILTELIGSPMYF